MVNSWLYIQCGNVYHVIRVMEMCLIGDENNSCQKKIKLDDNVIFKEKIIIHGSTH